MKRILLIVSLLTLASCGGSTEATPVVEDTNPDVKTLYVQSCENKDADCKQLLCNKDNQNVFVCSEGITPSENCGGEKSFDKIVNKYKICSDNADLLKNYIFNYSEKPNKLFEEMTPNEIEAKITEELTKVEEGGESEWLGTFLASAGGALLGGIIANKLFGGGSAQVPQRPNNIENNRSVTKDSLAETKEQSKTETQARDDKRKETVAKNKESSAKKSSSKTTTKKTTRKKRR
ncbi:MAG: hypothetical protein Q9M94_05390 [Candidatus Gracilibacteria bacterium]|nr:hypothetical protein [Candidatus Gracilibacteria bacterium]